jgi:hypothetical protein
VSEGEQIDIQLNDGKIHALVEGISEKKE